MMAGEAIKLLTGVGEPLIGRVAAFDALSGTTREIEYRRDPDAARPGSLEERTAVREPDPERSITPAKLQQLLAGPTTNGIHETPPLLLDVREAPEASFVSLPHSVLIPLGQLPDRLGELDELAGGRDGSIVVYCHHGVRSARALETARGGRVHPGAASDRRHRRLARAGRARDGGVLMAARDGRVLMGRGDDTPGARTPVDDHTARVVSMLERLRARMPESVPLGEALGRILTRDVASPIELPPFRNSQMDGYAVRAVDVASAPVSLPVVGEVAAAPGAPAALKPGTAVKIMTGAPVPEGADTIVPVEDTLFANDHVSIARGRTVGEYVRDVGSDLRAGDVIVQRGTVLASRHLAALAAAGITDVEVAALVRVAVISTGSELVAPGGRLDPGQIFDSNGVALAAAVRATGAEVVLEGRVSDDAVELEALLEAAIAVDAELILTSGGISMGDHEVVRELLEPHGALVDVLAMQPGGPQALAHWHDVPVVCFPGNPVSSQLSFEIFVAPALRELAGRPARVVETRVLDSAVRSIAGRRQFLRGRRVGHAGVTLVGGPSSHLVAALAASDVLIVIPEDVTELAAGDSVETWAL